MMTFFYTMYDDYSIRMNPLVRLPIFVMGMCAGFVRVHSEQKRAQQADASQTPVSRRDVPLEEATAGHCFHPAVSAVAWLIATLTATAMTLVCRIHFMSRFWLEVGFPILFYEFLLAVTNPAYQFACITSFFRCTPMRFLGDISMSTYMIHILLAATFGLFVQDRIWGDLAWWTVLAVVPASILLGWLMTEFFEKPIARRLRPDNPPATVCRFSTPKPPAVMVGSPLP